MVKKGSLGTLKQIAGIIKYLLDPKVPFIKKLPALGWIVYLIYPIDFLPDPVLGLGIIDDIVLLLFIASIMRKRVEDYTKKSSVKSSTEEREVIDRVEYKVEEDEGD